MITFRLSNCRSASLLHSDRPIDRWSIAASERSTWPNKIGWFIGRGHARQKPRNVSGTREKRQFERSADESGRPFRPPPLVSRARGPKRTSTCAAVARGEFSSPSAWFWAAPGVAATTTGCTRCRRWPSSTTRGWTCWSRRKNTSKTSTRDWTT